MNLSLIRLYSLCLFMGALSRIIIVTTVGDYTTDSGFSAFGGSLLFGFLYDSVVIGSMFLVLCLIREALRLMGVHVFSDLVTKSLAAIMFAIFLIAILIDVALFTFIKTKMRMWLIINNWDQVGPAVMTVVSSTGSSYFLAFGGLATGVAILAILAKKGMQRGHAPISWLETTLKSRMTDLVFFAVASLVWNQEPLWRQSAFPAQPELLTTISGNGLYNLGMDVQFYLRWGKQDRYFSTDELKRLYAAYFKPVQSDESPLGRSVPDLKHIPRKQNVVVILMEYMGAYLLPSLSPNGPKLATYLDELSHESLFFTRALASSTRTNHGFVSTVAAFPSILNLSVIRNRNGVKIKTIATVLQDYDSTFLYSGDIGFDHMDNLAEQGDFKHLVGDQVLLSENPSWKGKRGQWGYPDHMVLDYLNRRLQNHYEQNIPTATIVLTTSNHEPFDIPSEFLASHPALKPGSLEAAAVYSDWSLRGFFETAKTLPYYQDTIFVLVADHSRFRADSDGNIKGYHIPFIIHSARLGQYNGRFDMLAKQVDVLPTVLGLMGRSLLDFEMFGQDLLKNDGRPNFAVGRDNDNFVYAQDDHVLRLNLANGHEQLFDVDRFCDAKPTALPSADADKIRDELSKRSKVFLQATKDRLFSEY